MDYRIKRDGQEFGPYSLADLQKYVQSGNISPQDMALSEGMDEWIPVSQILGDIPIPPTLQVGAYGGLDPNAATQQTVPLPPNLPWPVLLITYLSLFPLLKIVAVLTVVWIFIQANWARKLSGKNTALVLVAMEIVGLFTGGFIGGLAAFAHMPALVVVGSLFILAGAICRIFAAFSIRNAMEEYYNSVENIGLSMSGVMVFLFSLIYIQYFVNRIARWKKTGELN